MVFLRAARAPGFLGYDPVSLSLEFETTVHLLLRLKASPLDNPLLALLPLNLSVTTDLQEQVPSSVLSYLDFGAPHALNPSTR